MSDDTIPIGTRVFFSEAPDVVEMGVVRGYLRRDGNITGYRILGDVSGWRLIPRQYVRALPYRLRARLVASEGAVT